MAEALHNYVQGTIAPNGCSHADATITLDDASGFPGSFDYRCAIEDELVAVVGITGNVLSVSRGIEGTTAADHSAGTIVGVVLTAGAIIQYVSEH